MARGYMSRMISRGVDRTLAHQRGELPVVGCYCGDCEAEREAAHADKLGHVTGVDADDPEIPLPEPKGAK